MVWVSRRSAGFCRVFSSPAGLFLACKPGYIAYVVGTFPAELECIPARWNVSISLYAVLDGKLHYASSGKNHSVSSEKLCFYKEVIGNSYCLVGCIT